MDAGDHRLERYASIGVGLRIEEDLRVAHALGGGPRQVGPGQIVEILFRQKHAAASVVDVEERLEIAEDVGAADLLDGGIGQLDTVAPRQLEHQLGLECAFDVQVQFGLG